MYDVSEFLCQPLEIHHQLCSSGANDQLSKRLNVYTYFIVMGYILPISHAQIFVQQFRIDVRKYFFSNRIIERWNSLLATPNGQTTYHLWEVS